MRLPFATALVLTALQSVHISYQHSLHGLCTRSFQGLPALFKVKR